MNLNGSLMVAVDPPDGAGAVNFRSYLVDDQGNVEQEFEPVSCAPGQALKLSPVGIQCEVTTAVTYGDDPRHPVTEKTKAAAHPAPAHPAPPPPARGAPGARR